MSLSCHNSVLRHLGHYGNQIPNFGNVIGVVRLPPSTRTMRAATENMTKTATTKREATSRCYRRPRDRDSTTSPPSTRRRNSPWDSLRSVMKPRWYSVFIFYKLYWTWPWFIVDSKDQISECVFPFQIKRGREYIHQRNPKINLILTAVAIIFLALGLGLGIGHFLGWSERLELQEMYAEVREDRMDELTDSLVSCMTGEEAAGGDDQDLDDRVIQQGGNSMRKFWAWQINWVWLKIPYTKKVFKNVCRVR